MIARLRSSGSRLREEVSRHRLRFLFVVILVLSAAGLAMAATDGLSTATREDVPEAPPTENHTVITESGRAGTITAYAPDGDVLYYNNSRTKYFDVDPLEDDPLTIEYTATDTVSGEGPTCTDPPCALNVIERVDLETGDVDVIYERYDYKELAGEWHDADRVNETHVLVADIVDDQVFLVNTETEIIEWLWDAQSEYPVEEAGPYPEDWAHINDVEYIEEGTHAGRVMASLRNQDQVVFIDPEEGLLEDWTLGAEDDYDIMFEQHNPDYIPESRGGPAIVVSDSENARVQEFQREDDGWTRTWEWSDERMQWPRDVDRLPNGNTLVTDTHGNRVMELDEEGEIVWQVPSTLPYEAERLEAGDESTGGHSASELGLASRTDGEVSEADGIGVLSTLSGVVDVVVPHRVKNGILFAAPVWMGRLEFAIAGVAILTGLTWVSLELAWWLRRAGFGVRSPVYRRGDD